MRQQTLGVWIYINMSADALEILGCYIFLEIHTAVIMHQTTSVTKNTNDPEASIFSASIHDWYLSTTCPFCFIGPPMSQMADDDLPLIPHYFSFCLYFYLFNFCWSLGSRMYCTLHGGLPEWIVYFFYWISSLLRMILLDALRSYPLLFAFNNFPCLFLNKNVLAFLVSLYWSSGSYFFRLLADIF